MIEKQKYGSVKSPYVPDCSLRWSKSRNRWQTHRPGTHSSMWHSQRVWEYFNGPVPEGMHVHHKNGRADRMEDDHISNLMLLDRKWNSDIFPTLSRAMEVPEQWITEAFLEADPSWSDPKIFVFIVDELDRRKGLQGYDTDHRLSLRP